jgi:hypothetical protein
MVVLDGKEEPRLGHGRFVGGGLEVWSAGGMT